jgi:hypothetical protein
MMTRTSSPFPRVVAVALAACAFLAAFEVAGRAHAAAAAGNDEARLLRLLASKQYVQRQTAMAAMAELDGDARKRLVPLLADMAVKEDWLAAESAALALKGMGPAARPAVPALSEALKANLEQRRIGRARVFASVITGIDPDSAAATLAPLLTRVLKSEDNTVIYEACTMLRELGPAAAGTAASTLTAMLSSDNGNAAAAAARALADIGAPPEALDPLLKGLMSRHGRLSYHAAEALLTLGPKAEKAIPNVIQLVHREQGDRQTCRLAVRLLARIGRPALPALVRLMTESAFSDHHVAAVETAVNVISRFSPEELSEFAPELMPVLENRIKHKAATGWYARGYVMMAGAFGEAAKPLVPLMSRMLEAANRAAIRAATTNTTMLIDSSDIDIALEPHAKDMILEKPPESVTANLMAFALLKIGQGGEEQAVTYLLNRMRAASQTKEARMFYKDHYPASMAIAKCAKPELRARFIREATGMIREGKWVWNQHLTAAMLGLALFGAEAESALPVIENVEQTTNIPFVAQAARDAIARIRSGKSARDEHDINPEDATLFNTAASDDEQED